MNECYATVGPLCFATETKFMIWAVGMTVLWTIILLRLLWSWRDRRRFRKPILDQVNRIEGGFYASTLKVPEKSEWTVLVIHNFVLHPDKGAEPNWFHRKMQELCFGFKWRKRGPTG